MHEDFLALLDASPEVLPCDPRELLDTLYGWVIVHIAPEVSGPYLQAIARRWKLSMGEVRSRCKTVREGMQRAEDEAKEAAANAKSPEWHKRLKRSKAGAIHGNPGNVNVYLTNDPQWLGACAYDLFQDALVWLREPPWTVKDKILFKVGQHVTDEDAVRLQIWFCEEQNVPDVSYDTATRALDVVGRTNSFHPIMDWLSGITWDGTARVESFLSTCTDAPDTPYTRAVSRIFFVSAIARVYAPGCKCDTMVIFEGPQGIGKSTMVRYLFGSDYFSDRLSPVYSKDALQELSNVWCLEMAELTSWNKADSNQAKAFLSSAVDRYRPSYGRRVRPFPRKLIFVGTTNRESDLGYFQDQTGGRRYLPIACTKTDLATVLSDRDQLWAEALHLYKQGAKWWPSTEEDVLCNEQQSARRQIHPWETLLETFFRSESDHPTFTTDYLLSRVLSIPAQQQTFGHLSRLGTVLKTLGWAHHRVRTEGEGTGADEKSRRPFFFLRPHADLEALQTAYSEGKHKLNPPYHAVEDQKRNDLGDADFAQLLTDALRESDPQISAERVAEIESLSLEDTKKLIEKLRRQQRCQQN